MRNNLILLVEDNADDEELALMALRESNIQCEVVVARDGVEALDYLMGTGPQAGRDLMVMPAVILLDLKLPKIDGLEVLRRIRGDERTRHLPVVILTSSQEEHDLIACYREGCNSYVRKPVSFSQFGETARQLGAYWLLVNEIPPMKSS